MKGVEARSYEASLAVPAKPKPRRSARKLDTEPEDFIPKWQGLEKKEEKSRAELLGVTQPRLPKAALKKLAKGDARYYDPDSDDPLQRATLGELETMALDKSKDVTSDLRNVLKITRETENIGAQTLQTLHKQGEQISRTHDKAVVLDHELSTGEKLLSSLGPMFSFGWKPKKGKTIKGSKYHPDANGSNLAGSRGSRGDSMRDDEDDESLETMDRVKKEFNKQDEMLDEVSSSLNVMNDMAKEMGNELDRQDHALDDLTGDVDELNSRLRQSNQRGRKLLKK